MSDDEERRILSLLDECVRPTLVKHAIDEIVLRVQDKLAGDDTALMAWEPIPLVLYGERLPAMIQSSWVFILRANTISGAERHPNSHQRMMSYCGTGDFQVQEDSQWMSHLLADEPKLQIEHRWISIPVNVWHQAVVSDKNWVVVSFHTVPAEELIEERPDTKNGMSTRQRLYLDFGK